LTSRTGFTPGEAATLQLSAHLVGREGELGLLEGALGDLETGRPAAIHVTGEPGIGKTRLLAELADRADARGYLVLRGSASELERDLPFGAFVDALDEYVRGLAPDRIAALEGPLLDQLGHVLPAISARAGGSGHAFTDERYLIHRAVRELLERLASPKPLVLVLDDLHWADAGSVELLGSLLHRPPGGPVCLALAARPRQLHPRVAAALERAYAAGRLTRVEPAPLTRDGSARLLAGNVDGGVAARLFELSEGNPFYLEQLARSVGRLPQPPRHRPALALAGVEIPGAVAASLGDELALLTDVGRRVLDGAAVAGDPFEPDLAAAAAGVAEGEALAALDELLRVDLVRVTDVPRRFQFRHPLVRRAVYDTIPGGWRIAAHERSATALRARGASATSLAHHVEQAGRHGDPEAIAVLREAGDALVQRAPGGAANWFEAALRLLPDAAPAQERADLLMALASARAAAGRLPEAHDALLTGLDLVPADDAGLRVKLTLACADLEQLLGHHAEARARLERALELGRLDPADRAAVMIHLALDSFYRPSAEGWRHWAEQAVELTAAEADAPLRVMALAVAALLCAFGAEYEEGRRYRDEAAALADSIPDTEMATRLPGLVHLIGAEVYLDHFPEGAAHAERAIGLARAAGQGGLLPTLVPAYWTALWMQGRLAQAGELLDGAIENSRLIESGQTLAWSLFNRGIAAALAGDLELALTATGESAELARGFAGSFIDMWSAITGGLAHLESGQAPRAAELIVAGGGGPDLPLIPGVWRVLGLEWLTRCWLALGRREDAAEAVALAAVLAEAAAPLKSGRMWWQRAAALTALHAADAETAAEHALSSAAIARDLAAPLEEAFARATAGRALAVLGRRDRAVAELEHAAAAFDACGAIRYRDDAERELRRLGRRAVRTTRGQSQGSGIDALTERELQVARLVVDRKTNPEIAEALFLSQKTVETHMRNIFVKLGVSSRVDVARAVEAADPDAGAAP
jgi:DNA-binding NarL/FixJ family response regulator